MLANVRSAVNGAVTVMYCPGVTVTAPAEVVNVATFAFAANVNIPTVTPFTAMTQEAELVGAVNATA